MDRFRRRSLQLGLPSPVSEANDIPTPVFSPVEPSTPDSASERDPKRFATLSGRFSSRSSSVVVQPDSKPKHLHLETTFAYQALTLPFDDKSPTKLGPSPRRPSRPRHVPIIIPDYASPYGPPQDTCAVLNSSTSLSESLLFPAPADATNSDTESSKSREKEGHQNDSKAAMNTSGLSLTASEPGLDSAASSIHHSTSQTNLASQNNQQNTTAANVSGLVCNVHRTMGQEPPPLVGATTTIIGDKLYVFGGRVHSKNQPYLSSKLYELDLVRRHWTKVDTSGDVPPPRYFHSVCALGDTKLVCYGGMSPATQSHTQSNGSSEPQPEVVVMSDIHVYDVPTRKWTQIQPSRSDSPQGRYAHCATILPSSAVFASADSHVSAIHHNPSSTGPHSGTIGVQIDGTGGAEMVVVGGQDSNNNYIAQISVFNMRNLKWMRSTPYDRNCGAYKSMVTALPGVNAQKIGRRSSLSEGTENQSGTPMLIYSNYNFLDVRLELQVRTPDGNLEEKSMNGPISPPGLRFPNGGVINGHFVVSGTYLTSSKHEYALWALDLRTLTWAMIDTAGTVFGQGSWNRGVLWNRRNTYVILDHRKRNLVSDYNHRRLNFAHLCLVELEAYGLYDNPRRNSPSSAYVSNSAPSIPASLQQSLPSKSAAGRSISVAAEQLGQIALQVTELCDMEIVAQGGERIPCNSSILARRWGPFFSQLVLESTSSPDAADSESATLRPSLTSRAASRVSAVTITPSTNGIMLASDESRSQSRSTNRTLVELPSNSSAPAASRGRSLYLLHTASTIRLMLHFLYTSSLPSLGNPLFDGLQEATIERLHEALDGRNAAAVFNAAAMAAGGGRATGMGGMGTLAMLERRESAATTVAEDGGRRSLLSNSNTYGTKRGHGRTGSGDSMSTATSATTSTTFSEGETGAGTDGRGSRDYRIWSGEMSTVIGLHAITSDPKSLSEQDLLICSPTVYGCSLKRKQWLEFAVAYTSDIDWDESSFGRLAIPADTKKAIQALSEAHLGRDSDVHFEDFVAGKGRGLIVLLHGSPGVGKTLTAETISEHVRRPFYTISAGDLGTIPDVLEKNLSEILELSSHWKATLLLDEADVFVEQRATHDIQRNALVCVFLRKLEYYAGIMFFTTNRVKTIDEAIASRIHLSLQYDDLHDVARKKVWTGQLAKAVTRYGGAGYSSDDLNRLAGKKLNGRQITNATSVAQAMAAFDKKAVNFSYPTRAIDLNEQLQCDFRGAGHFDNEHSYM
ncbi:hypothetical protein OHC33_008654 [Knufia fluminis]|uniref:AAA+ ATPase domain-containing protein n=1 Tax=Knufia fluminis TaxID=191047 RepID=A0AAN8I4V4_9EURO|nr:hypothetical protein OHC33_008654 [Knufia fluminis]